MSEASLTHGGEEGAFALQGSLSVDTVPSLWARANAELHDAPELTIDLQSVERADSAGLALLIEWTRWARQNGQQIRFINLPDQMLAIARVSGLDTMLPFYRADAGRD